MSTGRLGYRPGLDGLRGIGAVMVMLFHLGMLRGGFLGVDLFFVLSGFLITTILLEEHTEHGRIDFSRFYIRRFFRLVPAFYVYTLVAWLYCHWVAPEFASRIE